MVQKLLSADHDHDLNSSCICEAPSHILKFYIHGATY